MISLINMILLMIISLQTIFVQVVTEYLCVRVCVCVCVCVCLCVCVSKLMINDESFRMKPITYDLEVEIGLIHHKT